jgi:hypothetical protein
MPALSCRDVLLPTLIAIGIAGPPAGAADPEAVHAAVEIRPSATVITADGPRMALDWTVSHGVLRPGVLRDLVDGTTTPLGSEIFRVVVGIPDDAAAKAAPVAVDGEPAKPKPASRQAIIDASSFSAATPTVIDLPADPSATRLVNRLPGRAIEVALSDAEDGLSAIWRIELRSGTSYVRELVTIIAGDDAKDIREVRLFDRALPGARIAGSVDGSPIIAGDLFLGVEHPMAANRIEQGMAIAAMPRRVELPAGKRTTASLVLGVARPGQMRRDFLHYLECERARPYQPYLNYNTWYDIGYFSRYSEPEALETVRLYGEELVRKRGVRLDSLVFDDGWDDTATLWKFHRGMPNEFREVRKLAETYGTDPGVWFSPWGGYGDPRANRLEAGRKQGYETYTTMDPETHRMETLFALSGPKYYKCFHDMCVHMIQQNGINSFKFDGTGDASHQVPGSQFGSDFEAAIALITDLRRIKPDIYINLTTGTWPSPFWTRYADSIWRDGEDHSFAGVGTRRQQWMTYRDGMVYRHDVTAGPLYPLNALMLHGVIFAEHARGLQDDPANDLPAEIWSAFACGTQMQELYITPKKLAPEHWDALAAAATWSRANARTLVDTHWLGGDPLRLAVYGWASWSPDKGIICLRNPSDQPQPFSIAPAAAFELPAGAATRFAWSSPVRGATVPAAPIEADAPLTLTLAPFELVLLEATPQDAAGR